MNQTSLLSDRSSTETILHLIRRHRVLFLILLVAISHNLHSFSSIGFIFSSYRWTLYKKKIHPIPNFVSSSSSSIKKLTTTNTRITLWLSTGTVNGEESQQRNTTFTSSSSTKYSSTISQRNQIPTPVELQFLEFTTHVPKIRDMSSNQDTTARDGSLETFTDTSKRQSTHDPVLLLHGLLGQKRNFASLGQSLATQLQKPRHIYALDLRNHGDNTHDWREDMSYTEMANDVLYFMDTHNITRAILIGHSMGGKVAKVVALRYPHRISGLIVLDIAPVVYSSQTDSHWKAVEQIIHSMKNVKLDDTPGKTKKDIDLELRPWIQDPALRAFVLTNIDVDRPDVRPKMIHTTSTRHPTTTTIRDSTTQLRWKINLDAIERQLHVLAGFDYGDHLEIERSNNTSPSTSPSFIPTYHGDTYFITGGSSRFVRGTHLPTIAQYFTNYMMTTIRGSGHWVHAEAPDATLALLKAYLDR